MKCYKSSLVLCPVTLLQHWQKEIRRWYPWFRVCILHESLCRSSGSLSLSRRSKCFPDRRQRKSVIQKIKQSENGILITTYEHLRIYARDLLMVEWGYAILDEGHKIKNPDADITLVVKQVRLLLSNEALQNDLVFSASNSASNHHHRLACSKQTHRIVVAL